MKKIYETPKLDIELLNNIDVMTASDDEAERSFSVPNENAGARFNSIMNWR